MRITHLGVALLGGAIGYQMARARHRQTALQGNDSAGKTVDPKHYESKSNPRTLLSEESIGSARSGSGLEAGNARPAQTSGWYGNDPAVASS